MFLLAGLFFLIAPTGMSASDKGPEDIAAIAEPDRGNFEGDVSEAAADMLESLSEMRRYKFFSGLNKLIEKGDIKKAEKILKKRDKDVPGQKSDEAYVMAKSKIAYAKGDYKSAYAEADGLIAEVEKAFAPQKPYEIDFKNKNQRDTVAQIYTLRYQALSGMHRHEEALADLNRVEQLVESPELFRAKTSVFLWLGKYAEAAEAAEKAYAMDKDIFVNSQHRERYCQILSGQGYNVKPCAFLSAATKKTGGQQKLR